MHRKTDILSNALLASAAVPTIFPPYSFNGHQLFDGGVIEQAPLTYAIKKGCDTIFVIMNNSVDTIETKSRFRSIYSIGRRTATLIEWMTTKRTLERAFETNVDVEAYAELKRSLIETLEREDPDHADHIRRIVTTAFSETTLSLKNRRNVRIHVLSPDASEIEAGSNRLLDYKNIPYLLERGEREATELITKLEKSFS